MRKSKERFVKKLLSDWFNIPTKYINRTSRIVDDLGGDELDFIEIILTLEEEFECDILDEEAEKITTVGQLIDYMTNKENNAMTNDNRTVASTDGKYIIKKNNRRYGNKSFDTYEQARSYVRKKIRLTPERNSDKLYDRSDMYYNNPSIADYGFSIEKKAA